MKKKDTDAELKKAKQEIERLRNENRNLKRRVNRLKIKDINNETITQSADNEKDDERVNEVTTEGIEEIKKKLRANGMTERTMDVVEWFLSEVTGSPKK